jgi:Tol biopolymer transport system component
MEYLLPERPEEHDFWGVWGPQGRRFYFNSNRHENGNIHVFRADTEPGHVYHKAVPDSLPFWSHDGSTMGWADGETRVALKAMELW